MRDVIDDVICLCLTHVEFIFISAVLLQKFYEGLDDEGVVLGGYAEADLTLGLSGISLIKKIRLVEDLSGVSQEFFAFLRDLDTFIASRKDRDPVFFLEFQDR